MVALQLWALWVAACGGRAARADSVGVAECDEYLAKVQACMASEPRIKAMAAGYAAQKDAWKQMARTNAADVKTNCKAALDGFERAMPGCR
jgi:hypothetical protein